MKPLSIFNELRNYAWFQLKIKEKFITISERFTSTTKSNDGLFISESFDATSHFENETETVLRLYTEITGKELDLENLPEDVDE